MPTYQYFRFSSISGLYHTDGKIRILKAGLVESGGIFFLNFLYLERITLDLS